MTRIVEDLTHLDGFVTNAHVATFNSENVGLEPVKAVVRNSRTGYDDNASTEVRNVVDTELRLWRKALLDGRPHGLLEVGGNHDLTGAEDG